MTVLQLYSLVKKLQRKVESLCCQIGNISGWSLVGNAGTDSDVNFIGTTDNTDLVFRRNSVFSGMIGAKNTSLGLSSGQLGDNNTAVGVDALEDAEVGSAHNVAVGVGAAANLTSGENNTVVGSGAGSNLSTETGCVIIGRTSEVTGSNAIALGSGALAAANEFAIPDGVTKIKWRGISYTLPAVNAPGVLTNDGAGNLTWA